MSYFINGITKHYADFSGRARRKEFWLFHLFVIIAELIATIIDHILGTTFATLDYGVVYALTVLALILPSLAVSVRRLHDVGKSGWFLLIFLVPVVGFIWPLVLYCIDGQPGANAYGENPKAAAETDAPA